jgi:hypothetical protein
MVVLGPRQRVSYKRIHTWEIMSLIVRILDVVGKIKELHDLWMRHYENRNDLLGQITAYLAQEADQNFNVNLPFLEFLLSDMKGKFEGFEKDEYPQTVAGCQIAISELCQVISCIKIQNLLNEMINM